MSTFLEICGVLWLVSVVGGGLWVGLCALTDWRKRRRERLANDWRWCAKHEMPLVRDQSDRLLVEWCARCTEESLMAEAARVREARDV